MTRSRPDICPDCGASVSAHTGSYCQACGHPLTAERPLSLHSANDKGWGEDIVEGATVTSRGRHGAGQPMVTGRVLKVEGPSVTVDTPNGPRNRTARNLRVIEART